MRRDAASGDHGIPERVMSDEAPRPTQTPPSIKATEVELVVTLFGIDDTSLQPVHARHRYTDDQIVWGARHADILHEDETGQLALDLRKFDELVSTAPTAEFPYPEDRAGFR
jgi:inward rectifier potassium channel